MPAPDDRTRALARVLWDFHRIEEPVRRADVILALGSHDDRVAVHGASLFHLGLAPLLVVTGGAGKITGTLRSEPEGVRYAAVVRAMGVPGDRLVVERHATNTGENLLHARTLLAERGVWPRSAIIACKPSMTRRALHASAAQWPEVAWQVSAPAIAFESYPSPDVPEDLMISLLVGDLQRMWVYAERGFQTPALVPPDVHEAFEELVRLGYDEFVIDGDAVPG